MSKSKRILIVLGTMLVLTCTLSCVEYTAYSVLLVWGRNGLFHALIALALTISGFTALAVSRITESRYSVVSVACYACMMVALFIVKYYSGVLS